MGYGTPWVIYGTPWMTYGAPRIILGTPWVILGTPRMILGTPWKTQGEHDLAYSGILFKIYSTIIRETGLAVTKM